MRRMTSYSSDIWRVGGSGCVGQDSNLGTPSGRDLESLAFDQAWLPTRGPRRGRATLNLSRPGSTGARPRRFFGGVFFRAEGTVHGPVLHEVLLCRARESAQRRFGMGEEGVPRPLEDR